MDFGADGHGPDCLDTAEYEDLVGARHVLSGNDCRSGLAAEGRGTGDDAPAAGNLRGEHRHMGRREQRILAAGDVAPDRGDGHMTMAERDAGEGFDGELGHCRLLPLGEVANLSLGEGDVGEVLVGELRHAVVDLGLAQAEVLSVPIVELAA